MQSPHPDPSKIPTSPPATRGAHSPGLGLGWTRVAQAVAEEVSPDSIDGIWLFAPVRREWREWGTAVITCRLDSERRRIYTARYWLTIRGRERGQGRVLVEQVGESPAVVLHEVIAGVQERAGETEPPVEISPELWYPPEPADQAEETPHEGEREPAEPAATPESPNAEAQVP